jgi:hypothetical protein
MTANLTDAGPREDHRGGRVTMSRAQRRAEVARFRREVRDGTAHASDRRPRAVRPSPAAERCDGALLQERRVASAGLHRMQSVVCRWFGTASRSVPVDDPGHVPSAASISGLCDRCWRDLSDNEIEAVELRVLRKVGPGAEWQR